MTKTKRYRAYATICVYMNISQPILEFIELSFQNEDIFQPIEYEHLPFQCHCCHEYEHLFKDSLLVNHQPPMTPQIMVDRDGF